jgi:hypothetical protein
MVHYTYILTAAGTHDAFIGSRNAESVVGREVVNESDITDMHADIGFSNGNKNRPNNVPNTTTTTVVMVVRSSFRQCTNHRNRRGTETAQ